MGTRKAENARKICGRRARKLRRHGRGEWRFESDSALIISGTDEAGSDARVGTYGRGGICRTGLTPRPAADMRERAAMRWRTLAEALPMVDSGHKGKCPHPRTPSPQGEGAADRVKRNRG